MTLAQADRVRELSAWLAGTDIALLELSGPGTNIRLEQAAPASTAVRAGSVGIVLHAHPMRAEPLVRVGQHVRAGQAVALLKIGMVLLAVVAPRAGRIARVVAGHQCAVGYGEALVEIE